MAGQKGFYIALGAVAVAGIAWLGVRTLGAPDLPVRAAAGTPDTSGFTGYVIGAADAPIEVTEYADFQCPLCGDFDQVQWPDVKKRLVDTGKIRFRYRDFPLDPIHPETRIAAHAAACGDDQGKFWQMKHQIYARQTDWAFHGARTAFKVLGEAAANAGLDVDAWESCMEAGKFAARIEASHAEAIRLGVNGTPTFLIKGKLYPAMNSDELVRVVDSLIADSVSAGK